MTRTEAIEKIQAALPALADEQVDALAEMVQAWAEPREPLDLTPEELAGIERSREDFKHGRTLTDDEYQAEMDAFIARLAAKQPATT
jgi:hypothetical protein